MGRLEIWQYCVATEIARFNVTRSFLCSQTLSAIIVNIQKEISYITAQKLWNVIDHFQERASTNNYFLTRFRSFSLITARLLPSTTTMKTYFRCTLYTSICLFHPSINHIDIAFINFIVGTKQLSNSVSHKEDLKLIERQSYEPDKEEFPSAVAKLFPALMLVELSKDRTLPYCKKISLLSHSRSYSNIRSTTDNSPFLVQWQVQELRGSLGAFMLKN